MAISKSIIAPNGVTTKYHRIALLILEPNMQNTILVHSYIGEDGRNVEKDLADGTICSDDIDNGLAAFPYVDAEYLHADYDPEMTISKAYEWLKGQPEFIGSKDV